MILFLMPLAMVPFILVEGMRVRGLNPPARDPISMTRCYSDHSYLRHGICRGNLLYVNCYFRLRF